MKKFISLALVAAMIATMGVTAFAADPNSTQVNNGSYNPPIANPHASPWAADSTQQTEWNNDRTQAINRGTEESTEADFKKMTSKKVRVAKGDYQTAGYQPSENIVFMPLVYDLDGKTNTTDDQYYIIDTPPTLERHVAAGWISATTMMLGGADPIDPSTWGQYDNKNHDFLNEFMSTVGSTAFLTPGTTPEVKDLIIEPWSQYVPEIPSLTKGINMRKDWVLATNIEDFSDIDVDVDLTAGADYVRIIFIDIAGDTDQWTVKFVHHDNNTDGDVKVKGNMQLMSQNKKLGDDFNFSFKIAAKTLKFGADDKITQEGKEFVDNNGKQIQGIEFGGGDAFINLLDFNARRSDAGGTLGHPGITPAPYQTYDLSTAPKVADFTADVENIELEDDDSFHFEVKASHQGKVNLNYNNFADAKIMPKAPRGAELLFMNCYGRPEFDFTGTATFTFPDTDKEYFLYEINPDSTVSEVKGYTLNEDEDGFELKTRVLGRYVLSDMEFAPAALSVYDPNAKPGDETAGDTTGEQETTVEDGTKENPSTGVTTALVF